MAATPHEREPAPADVDDAQSHRGDLPQRLWAPWRMRYVAGGLRESGCIFCNRLAENDDVRTLILHRGDRAFVIMNLFPYNTGHVMIVPNAHVSSPEDADAEMLAEMTALRAPVLRALRRAMAPEGFNLGMNVGAVAGAGVADHLHEHIVPRWGGDANFMPILAATTVMPELIPVTYAKLRVELGRELHGADRLTSLVLTADRMRALADAGGHRLVVAASVGEPLWRAALRDIHDRGAVHAELAGWAGSNRAELGNPTLLFTATFPSAAEAPANHRYVDLAELLSDLDDDARAAVEQLSSETVP